MRVPRETFSDRAKDMIDLAYLYMTDTGPVDEKYMYVDVSQCASRAPWTATGRLKAITTSSEVWSYGKCRYLLPTELMAALGFNPQTCCVTSEAKTCQKSLAGEAMSWPCVSAATLALLTALPRVWEEGEQKSDALT